MCCDRHLHISGSEISIWLDLKSEYTDRPWHLSNEEHLSSAPGTFIAEWRCRTVSFSIKSLKFPNPKCPRQSLAGFRARWLLSKLICLDKAESSLPHLALGPRETLLTRPIVWTGIDRAIPYAECEAVRSAGVESVHLGLRFMSGTAPMNSSHIFQEVELL